MSLKKSIKKYNPFKNKTQIGDVKFKWKIKPKGLNTNLNLQISAEYEDVEFYAIVDGKPYQISKHGIGINSQEEDIFSAEIGFTKKF